MTRILIFIVTYNAERTVRSVLTRIPDELFKDPRFTCDILIIDDGSRDETFQRGVDHQREFPQCPLTVLRNPVNLGYGGNQKVGYRYAIENGYDHVVLLHGDGQYAPEALPKLLEPLLSKDADAVFGSRMMKGGAPLKGGMPLYKFIGNKVLTFLENKIVGSALSEYHSGYRLYSTAALKDLPFERNSNDFDFDTEIIIQLTAAKKRIAEIPIPTFYGDEICHVNGVKYALQILRTCVLYRVQRLGIFYDPKFDCESGNTQYQQKFDFLSSHSLARECVNSNDSVLILGCGPRALVEPFAARARSVTVVDQFIDDSLNALTEECLRADLNNFEIPAGERFSKILILDVIEHLADPERFLETFRNSPRCFSTELILTTPNIGFLPIRLMLLLGSFNYGKRGILDRTHTRLFTRRSLQRLLQQGGFSILEVRGIPAPFPLAFGRGRIADTLLAINEALCRALPGVFSYQIFLRAVSTPTPKQLLNDAIQHSEHRRNSASGTSEALPS